MEPLLLPVADAGRMLGIGRSKLYQLISDGELDVVKIGRRTLVKVASIKRLAGEGITDAAA